jgi:hypothetical protein
MLTWRRESPFIGAPQRKNLKEGPPYETREIPSPPLIPLHLGSLRGLEYIKLGKGSVLSADKYTGWKSVTVEVNW